MESEDRRKEILKILNKKDEAIKGMDLAKSFDVSRQIIVQDIALLRATGEKIISTPQGYIILKRDKSNKLIKTIVCKHEGYNSIKDELISIIDMGGKVLDVIVDHPLYGEIKSSLMIRSRLDVENFIKNIKETKAEPLSTLTNGIHMHSIEIENEEILKKIEKNLESKGYLVK